MDFSHVASAIFPCLFILKCCYFIFKLVFFDDQNGGGGGSSLWTPSSSASSVHTPFILAPPPAGTASSSASHGSNSSLSNTSNNGTSTGSPMKVPVKPPPLKSLPVSSYRWMGKKSDNFLNCVLFLFDSALVWIRWRTDRSALSFRPGSHGRPASSYAPDAAFQPGYALALSDPVFCFDIVVNWRRRRFLGRPAFAPLTPPTTSTFFTSS